MIAVYRLALRLLPPGVRDRHGEEMLRVFSALVREARARRSWLGLLHVAVSELVALAWFAWCERRNAPRPRRIDERLLAWPAGDVGLSTRRETRVELRQFVASAIQDLRYAMRGAARTPGFSAVCLLTLSLAIGANTAVFSVVNGVLLRPLPFDEPERLVVIGQVDRGTEGLRSISPGNFYDLQSQAKGFDGMAAFDYTEVTLTPNGRAERALGVVCLGGIFDVLGRRAAHGRVFTARDDQPGADRVVVVSARLASRLFGTDDPTGRALPMDGELHTVLGVMPPDFAFPDWNAEFWVPARLSAAFRDNRDQYYLLGVGRLRAGVSVEAARVQLDTLLDGIRRRFPQHTENARAGVAPMRDLLVQDVRLRLVLLMGAAVFILLISCSNLGNLLLARAATRRQEMAVRQALGARPLRLARQMLTESLLLAGGGGLIGLGAGALLLRALVSWLPADLPRAGGIRLDPGVLAFTVLASLASGLAFGLFPALQAAHDRGADSLRERTQGTRTAWVRSLLVGAEVALALMLLLGAGLLVRSFTRLSTVDPGFRPDQLLTMRVAVPTSVYRNAASRLAFFETALERLRRLPGVASVSLSSTLPVSGRGTGAWFNILDRPLPANQTPPGVPYRVVDPRYLSALGIPLRRGRHFTDRDGLGGTRAVIVSESVARRFWPDEDPVGKRIYLGAPDNRLFDDAEIVGIAADVKQSGLDESRSEAVYIPLRLMPYWAEFSIAIRTATDPASVARAAHAQIQGIDPSVPVVEVRPMSDVIATSLAPTRSSMMLVALFAVVALVEAIVGVFGVVAYAVSQRTTELGIRMALGANDRDILHLVLFEGMRPVVAGILIGLSSGLALAGSLQSLLFGVAPTDPATFVAVPALLAAVASLAIYLAARRAASVDPNGALRAT